jgi:hypothetical protein
MTYELGFGTKGHIRLRLVLFQELR